MTDQKYHMNTRLAHLGLKPDENFGIPNPPIYRTSTILSATMAQHRGDTPKPYDYGRIGTPTSQAFEESVAAIYGADTCISTPSGLSAITTAIISVIRYGDHVLFPDSLYGSTRRFASTILPQMGVNVTFYPPRSNAAIKDYCTPATKLIYMESPGSLTFEIQDVPAIVDVAKQRSIITMIDNTWGTALHLPVFEMGVDMVVEAGTKYIAGHSDTNLGIAAASGPLGSQLKRTATALGICAGPEDLYMGLRGLRTLQLRLTQSATNGIFLAEKLSAHPLVIDVLHPALPTNRDYQIYSRDFSGSCGLFGFVISDNIDQKQLDDAVEAMGIFAIGDSWGGYESLIKQAEITPKSREFTPEHIKGHLLRIYAGLEDENDLWGDIEQMLTKLTSC